MKELRNELLLMVGDKLRPLGFRPRKAYRDFYRDVGLCRQIFHISFINHVYDFDVTADVAIRHHNVEDALNRTRTCLNESVKKQTATLGAELGNIIGTGQHRWTVANVSNVSPVANDIVQNFQKTGLPFLARFSSLEETLSVLRQGGKEARLICPFSDERARITEIIAELLADAT